MLKRAIIRNFRSLNIDVSLDPLTVLVGKSGTGKSNFVAAFRFIRDYLRNSNDASVNWMGARGSANVLSVAPTLPFNLLFDLTFEIPGVDESFNYRLEWEGIDSRAANPKTINERLTVAGATVFDRCNQNWDTLPKTVPDPPSMPNVPALGSITGCREAQLAYSYLTEGVGCYGYDRK